jgi:hypothetical protein
MAVPNDATSGFRPSHREELSQLVMNKLYNLGTHQEQSRANDTSEVQLITLDDFDNRTKLHMGGVVMARWDPHAARCSCVTHSPAGLLQVGEILGQASVVEERRGSERRVVD